MKKHLKYAWYLARHLWFVLVECVRLGVIWRGLVHDLSKFRPSELFPYVEHFGGDVTSKRDKSGYYKPTDSGNARFDVAWLRHAHRNDHHWQHWTQATDDGGVKLYDMPEPCVREMLADWRGAGRAQGFSSVRDWYEKNQLKIKLTPGTRDFLHSLMEPDELPPKQKVTVITKAVFTGASLMPDGQVALEGKVLESREEDL